MKKARSRKPLKSSMGDKSESQIQKEIIAWLKEDGYLFSRLYLGPVINHIGGKKVYSKNPNSGWPDIIGLSKSFPRFFFGIEIKSANGKLSEKQKIKISEIENAGGFCIAARSLEDAKCLLTEEERNYESLFCENCRDKIKRKLESQTKRP